MKAIQLVLLAILICGCTSQSTAPQEVTSSEEYNQGEQVAVSEADQAKPEYICIRERDTGTHFSKRICRTKKQMEEDQEEARRVMEDSVIIDPGGR